MFFLALDLQTIRDCDMGFALVFYFVLMVDVFGFSEGFASDKRKFE